MALVPGVRLGHYVNRGPARRGRDGGFTYGVPFP